MKSFGFVAYEPKSLTIVESLQNKIKTAKEPVLKIADEKFKAMPKNRDQRVKDELLGRLVNAAKGTENLMLLFIECVEDDITLSENCNTLRGVWGEYLADGF